MQTETHPRRAAETASWDADTIAGEADRCSTPVALWTILGVSAALWWGSISLVRMAV